MWSRLLPFALASSLLLACQATPLSMEPVNGQAATQLPALSAVTEPDLRIFSFRVITPIENIDVFSVLQAAGAKVNTTLPVGQLKKCKSPKRKYFLLNF